MQTVFIIIFIALLIMVVISLVRGLIAFLRMTEEDLKSDGVGKSHQMQNKMMFNRIKYQALAVVALVILMMATRA
ncbi:HIG1 domain-containing protein [Sphingorhabdus sp. Alg239-R122]|uniref:HIG1 domain-containing protein n=1 Tax=Sphingorhabdus sp. Alg239-R122 TaxID=2305989 RepID=UPI0013DBE638|nr:HIG1 domain-containing protein [Sphingorhabdus sp. Alg239-R122]